MDTNCVTMKRYLFQTTATMKDYNCEKYWVDSKLVGDKYINAENVNQALWEYKKLAERKDCVEISDNALKTKRPMYIEKVDGSCKQVGYVITARSDFYDNDYKSSTQFIDLWVNILTVVDTEF